MEPRDLPIAVDEPLDGDALRRRALEAAGLTDPARRPPRLLVQPIVRRRGDDAWRKVAARPALPGDEARVWLVDLDDEAAVLAVNRRFCEGAYYASSLNDLWPDEREAIASALAATGADLLEICCGAGRVTRHLVRDGNRVVGVDTSRASIEFAAGTDRLGVTYRVADAAALPFDDAAFDAATCFDNSLGMLFSGRRRAVEEMVRVTRPGGRLLIGFRVVEPAPPLGVHVYVGGEGQLELAQSFTRAEIDALLDGLAPATARRLSARSVTDGLERAYGGRARFVTVDLA